MADEKMKDAKQLIDEEFSMEDILKDMVQKASSDLHIKAGSPPMMRIDGELVSGSSLVLSGDMVRKLCESIITDQQKAEFIAEKELDFAYSIPGLARFRVNFHFQRGSWAAAFRIVPVRPFTIDELKLPAILKEMAMKPRGLILVTGPTGSGKSTTMAAMINHINENKKAHIITVEDPIEFLHKDQISVISQREINADTHSFAKALRHILRQDPDVIMIGELRDLETTQIAVTAAETGHLVLASLHTNSASATVDRVIDIFPPHQQQQIRMQLSVTLEGVLCQTLMAKASGRGRVMAMELMPVNAAIRNIIREGKTHQIPNIIQAGATFGMKAMDMSLRDLFQQGAVSYEEALSKAIDPHEFNRLIGKGEIK